MPENIIMLTRFTSLKSSSLGMKLLELAYKLTLFLIGNDNCGACVWSSGHEYDSIISVLNVIVRINNYNVREKVRVMKGRN